MANREGTEGLDWENVELKFSDLATEKLNEFSNMMRLSGYDAFYRKAIIQGVHERVKQMEIMIMKGEKVRYRDRKQIEGGHRMAMGRYKDTWFLRGGNYTSVLNIQPTPDGKLAKMMRESIGKKKAPDGGCTKVVEMGGEAISNGLFKADPFKSKGCPFMSKCVISSKGGSCTLQRVIYELTCMGCI